LKRIDVDIVDSERRRDWELAISTWSSKLPQAGALELA